MCRTAALSLLLLLCAATLGGCAVFEQENRRTLNAMDRNFTPDSTAARWALAPVGFPAGVVAGVLDMVVVHPSTVFDDAWGDTVQLLWTPRDESRFRRAIMLPLVTIATPFVYVGDWLGRAIFAIPPRETG
jgi:hypothetical protein